jgi:hypothetical protein
MSVEKSFVMCQECENIKQQQEKEYNEHLDKTVRHSRLGRMVLEMHTEHIAEVIVAFETSMLINEPPNTGEWSDNQCSLFGELSSMVSGLCDKCETDEEKRQEKWY